MTAAPSEHRRRPRRMPVWTAELCHVPSGVVGQAVFALQRPLHAYFPQARAANRDAAAVPDSRCRACHEQALQGVVVSNGIRITTPRAPRPHRAPTATPRRRTAARLGGFARTTWTTVSSATWQRRTSSATCVTRAGTPLTRVKSSAFAVTHGPKWKTTHGMGDAATCTVCHAADDCADCHGPGVPHEPKFVAVHSSYAAEAEGAVRVLPQGRVLQRLPWDGDAAPGGIHSAACDGLEGAA